MQLKLATTVFDFQPLEWNRLVEDFPFMRWEFIASLEKANTIGQKQGFLSQIIFARDEHNELLGIYYGHLKNHSYGEYIFDWEWAQSYQAAGIQYYPKYTSSIPFSPVTGSKYYLSKKLNEEERVELERSLINFQVSLHPTLNSHALFIKEAECNLYQSLGFIIRHSFQYHWHNKKYDHFNNFLSELKSRKARTIKKERLQVQSYDLSIYTVPSEQLPGRAKRFAQFYLNTIEKKGSYAYLNEEFFTELFSSLSEHILVFEAQEHETGKIIAMSLYFKSQKVLYGRYWGADPMTAYKYPLLHFEMCYYLGVDYCIENKKDLFEAGAQGEHKIPRGFIPSLTFSAHLIRRKDARAAIGNFIESEKQAISEAIKNDVFHSPYKQKL